MAHPLPGYRITTAYKRPGGWSAGYHTGVDLAAPSGTPIRSMTSGTVEHVGWGGWGQAYGAHVIIRHGSYKSGYMHMSATSVHRGQSVSAGQVIGRVGTTGNSTGPHLHLETRTSPYGYNNRIVNPEQFFGGGGGGGGSAPKTYMSKLELGQRNSDSVKNLQRALKKAFPHAPAAKRLPVTGYYGPQTAFLVFKYKVKRMGQKRDKANRNKVGGAMAKKLKLPSIVHDR